MIDLKLVDLSVNHLSVLFQIKTPKLSDKESVLSCDLGIYTARQRNINREIGERFQCYG
jgi:hypothetical protein